jgi:hypothetical protein
MNDILFATVDFPKFNRNEVIEDILKIPEHFWFWDDYRATNMLPLMTKEGISGQQGTSNYRNGEFFWLNYAPKELISWFDNYVFPWMGMKTRIMVLKTKPNFPNNEHIDSTIDEVGTRQHKFRVVLKGKTNTLYFKTTQGDVSVPDVNEPFIMDGSWAHGMINYTDDLKLTVAAGAPWTGLDHYDNINILMRRSDYEPPKDLSKYIR